MDNHIEKSIHFISLWTLIFKQKYQPPLPLIQLTPLLHHPQTSTLAFTCDGEVKGAETLVRNQCNCSLGGILMSSCVRTATPSGGNEWFLYLESDFKMYYSLLLFKQHLK